MVRAILLIYGYFLPPPPFKEIITFHYFQHLNKKIKISHLYRSTQCQNEFIKNIIGYSNLFMDKAQFLAISLWAWYRSIDILISNYTKIYLLVFFLQTLDEILKNYARIFSFISSRHKIHRRAPLIKKL